MSNLYPFAIKYNNNAREKKKKKKKKKKKRIKLTICHEYKTRDEE